MIHNILLGIFQGLTEFLPVSSSGHLVIAKSYLQVKEMKGALLEVMLHFGTLISIFAVFWRDILEILRGVTVSFMKLCAGKNPKELWLEDHHTRLFVLIIIGSIPTGIIAILFGKRFESLFSQPVIAAIAIMLTGLILWFTRVIKVKKSQNMVNIARALIIGTVQGVAIIPGISRSGSTISAATYMGITHEMAVRYSFLLSIPAITGAVVIHLKEVSLAYETGAVISMIAGAGMAALVGYFALRFLIRMVNHGKLHVFSYYCWGFGCISALFFILR